MSSGGALSSRLRSAEPSAQVTQRWVWFIWAWLRVRGRRRSRRCRRRGRRRTHAAPLEERSEQSFLFFFSSSDETKHKRDARAHPPPLPLNHYQLSPASHEVRQLDILKRALVSMQPCSTASKQTGLKWWQMSRCLTKFQVNFQGGGQVQPLHPWK